MNDQNPEGYDFSRFFRGSADPSKTQKRISHEKRLRRRYLEKEGRRNNRGSHKGQKSGTGRKSW